MAPTLTYLAFIGWVPGKHMHVVTWLVAFGSHLRSAAPFQEFKINKYILKRENNIKLN